ncbi:hypothetical protein GCM10007392_25550 [Saccharospirillum salsuginis]|uniref:Uncharacterized protein n=1 Tax=Saccharospirillum salsuginis TaxID=418750 RepID=A0A918KBY4_9GAMM|nr:hypothetical protein GCM10007392_25550 [Saccharospirillum salsuginis]
MLSGCNTGSDGGSGDSLSDGTGSVVNGMCDFGKHDTAKSNGSHGILIQLPDAKCIGQDYPKPMRKSLPVTVDSAPDGLEIENAVKVFSGSQPTYTFLLTNKSESDYCLVSFNQPSVLDENGSVLHESDGSYLDGEIYSGSSVTTSTCISAGESIQFGEYLGYDPIDDFDRAVSFHVSSITAQVRDYSKEGVVSFVQLEWDSDESATFVNNTGKSIDLSYGFSEINYFDEDGYLIASLFLSVNDSGDIVGNGDTFTISSRNQWDYLAISTVGITLDWELADSAKSRVGRSNNGMNLRQLKRLEHERDLQVHSMSYSDDR